MITKPRKVIRDSIFGITKSLIRRLADRANLLNDYSLKDEIYNEFRNWTAAFLKNFLQPLYSNSDLKLYLDPNDLNMNIEYKYGTDDQYQKLISVTAFERLVREILQDIASHDANIRLSKAGFLLMIHYYVEKSIDLFAKIKAHMDITTKNNPYGVKSTKENRVSIQHMQHVIQQNY